MHGAGQLVNILCGQSVFMTGGNRVLRMATRVTAQSTALVALAAVIVGSGPISRRLANDRSVAVSTSSPLNWTRTMPSDVPKSCPITKPPDPPFVPPPPYPAKTNPNSFWFGTDKLWTQLRTDGTWKGPPHWSDGTFRQKLFFWREGYNWRAESRVHLIVTGRRLDATAPPLVFDCANAGWGEDKEHPFIVTGINIPTLGCWEFTGNYNGDKLTYVVWVAP
jgi:hypothetical protein